jgi:hypothetical protein
MDLGRSTQLERDIHRLSVTNADRTKPAASVADKRAEAEPEKLSTVKTAGREAGKKWPGILIVAWELKGEAVPEGNSVTDRQGRGR